MNAAIAAIRKHSSSDELKQIDKILEKSRNAGSASEPPKTDQ